MVGAPKNAPERGAKAIASRIHDTSAYTGLARSRARCVRKSAMNGVANLQDAVTLSGEKHSLFCNMHIKLTPLAYDFLNGKD
jgi:hypothetical protein